MLKVYIEFMIKKESRDVFLALMPQLKQQALAQDVEGRQVAEGTDQPLLFVEEFYVKDMDHYSRIKAERLNEDSPLWKQLHDCIQGGAQKLHIWAFKPLD
ncbi:MULTISPECIES: hypothetical protein [unclassified Paenibacillus]|uniref:hypothetical protein n=1 Tax=unclassified Paenibacillus TaxID=185978 RepID=UPI001AE72391|nr:MULTISPECIES: hypothetical protein [unclassified Paenibacillus]MBP1154067.1 hypothetical protein [Paenibacillus sp. PvP091]MBP1170548.1 hypothetical protein [Paenibacillus sp. PvR098]MBP2441576.1 hypothetical protein [Paenibacillus sp. PvP052]